MQNAFNKRKAEIDEFNEMLDELNIRQKDKDDVVKNNVPSDIMTKCNKCSRMIVREELIKNLKVCPYCNAHQRLTPKERLSITVDDGYTLLFTDLKENYLEFPNYEEKLNDAKTQTGDDESVVCVDGKINGIPVLVGVMNSFFMMGSMGSVTGEKITRLIEKAKDDKKPLVLFTTSGGARMQEGVISLFQMAKTSEALGRLNELTIGVLTDPTTGGVSASFASLMDITLAEPKATIGFAGKKVIENTIKETLPNEFQTSEFLLEKGYLDKIVERKDLKKTLELLLRLHNYHE